MTQPQVFVDSSPLGTVNILAPANENLIVPPTVASSSDRFWASPNRFKADTTKDTLELDFSDSQLVNIINLQIAHFPQQIAVEYISDGGTDWQSLLDGVTAQPIVVTVNDSYPAALPSPTVITSETHPQHDFQGHWINLNLDILPVEIRRIRFKIQRLTTGVAPVDRNGVELSYSVAVQNVYIGYRVDSATDIPRTAMRDDSITTDESFAQTSDMFGSTISFAPRYNRAQNLLKNTDTAASYVWKCEPQPVPDAVVNFYADVRDTSGNAQIIDQIMIDPLYNGPNINLYYSNDTPTADFQSNTSYLNNLQATVVGTTQVNPTNISFGVYGDASYIAVNNPGVINFDADEPWWLGMEFTPNFNVNTDTADHPIFSTGVFQIGFNKTGVYMLTKQGDRNTILNSYSNTSPIRLVASLENGLLHLTTSQNGQVLVSNIPASVPFTDQLVSAIYFGVDSAKTLYGNYTLTEFVLRKESWPGDDFLNDPSEYTTVGQFAGTYLSDQNTLLVFDPSNVTAIYPSGFRGGTAQRFDLLNWTPVPREYEMQRGAMTFPATKAKFWNLEITNLQPQYSDVYVPVTRTIKKFPPTILDQVSSNNSDRSNYLDLPTNVQESLYNTIPSNDLPLYTGTGGNANGISNTEVYVSTDLSTSDNLSTLGNDWSYQPLHAGNTVPRFGSIGVHTYQTEDVTQTSNITYVTGLRNISFGRSQITASQNASIYEEYFYDGTGIFQGNWLTPGNGTISSGSATYAQAQSVTYPTQRSVRAVQFAAQTTDSQQILQGSDLADETLWTNVGDATRLGISPSTPGANPAMLVSRRVGIGFWGDIAQVFGPTWNSIDGHVTYSQLEVGSNTPQLYGGVQSRAVATPNGGRLYAAVRTVATTDLKQPLTVQLIDTSSQAILAQNSVVMKKNQIKEITTSFDIASLGGQTGRTWGQLVGKNVYQSFSDNFARSNSTTLGQFTTGQYWTTSGGASQLSIASGTAKVNLVGNHSDFDAGTPWGTFSFTLGNAITTTTHSSAAPLVDLGGLYLMNDSTVQTLNFTPTLFTLSTTLTAGHKYDFQFMPTSIVPVGQQVSGTDPISQPYSIVIFDNGTWLQTYTGNRGFKTVRSLMGQTNQTFTAVSWTPSPSVQVDSIPGIFQLFEPTQLTQTSLVAGQTYSSTDAFGRVWMYQGAYGYGSAGIVNNAKSLVPGGFPSGTPAGSQMVVNVGEDYGALEFNVTQMPSGMTASSVVLAYLYYNPANTHALMLMGDGSIYNTVTASTVKTSMFTSATGGPITIRYASTSGMTSGFKSTWGITTQKQALIFLQSNVIKGVYAGNSLWETDIRGIGGGASGTGAGQYFTFEGFGWYSDASLLSTNTSATTWGQVDYLDTRTYASLENSTAPSTANIALRVIQSGITQDFWYIESASVFWDPLIWEFSCDGGITWWKAINIKNDPRGVLLFPYGLTSYSGLAWRLTSYAPNMLVSHLAIRPWYAGQSQGAPIRPTQLPQGPNLVPQDQYMNIDDDPRWQVWRNPIPRWWYASFTKLTL